MAVSVENLWYFMPISGWQWAALMNDGPHNWCSQRGARGSWISRLEHAAKLICFVRDGRRGERRLLSFRQERSTWCQERRRCSSCCLRCNPPTAAQPPSRHQSTHTLTHPHTHTSSTQAAQSSGVALTTDLSLMLNQWHFVTMPLSSLCQDLSSLGRATF